MSLKDLTEGKGAWKGVMKKFTTGLGDRHGQFKVTGMCMVRPTMDVVETFEERRTELEKKAGAAFESVECWILTDPEKRNQIIKEGFQATFAGDKVAFSQNPYLAIQSSMSVTMDRIIQNDERFNQLLLVRVSLGKPNVHQREVNQKYVLEDLTGVIPSFLIKFEWKNDDENPLNEGRTQEADLLDSLAKEKQAKDDAEEAAEVARLKKLNL